MKRTKLGLLVKVIIAIVAGSLIGLVAPEWLARIAATISKIFGDFLNFAIPLIILGLVAPGIAELGKGAGKLLAITVAIAYGSTVFSGFFTYGAAALTYPRLLSGVEGFSTVEQTLAAQPYFTIGMPPIMNVMSALLLAFILGVTLSQVKGNVLKNSLIELREVINIVISKIIIPALPLYIACIFLGISSSGQVSGVMSVFVLIIAVIFVLHVTLLVLYFCVAALIAGGNPFKYLKTMMPAYMTALGTQSSAATIPVTLRQSIKNGVDEDIADFVIPLTGTIHLAGSMMKITGCAYAIIVVTGMEVSFATMVGFIFLLGITMVAAPGVPSGAIMAALGVLSTVLGFDETMLGLMIALSVAMDSFGTACNVTGDGAIAIVINKIYNKQKAAKAA